MSNDLYRKLKKADTEDMRSKRLMRDMKTIFESKKNRSFIQKLLRKKPKTQPKGWD